MSWIRELPCLSGTVLGLDDPLPDEAVITVRSADIGDLIQITRPWVDEKMIVQIFKAIYKVMELDDPHITRRNLTGWHEYGRFCRIKRVQISGEIADKVTK